MRQTNGFKTALLAGASALAFAGTAGAQVSSINSAIIVPRVYNDVPSATGTYTDLYPASITLGEAGVNSASGFADRDVWYFSNNSGSSAYAFQNNDYFKSSFTVDLTGGTPGLDIEAGYLFSNPTGSFGGDCQMLVTGAGVVVQFGGPSYYPFSPAAGGYPGAGATTPNYVEGTPITFGFNYLIDPNTNLPAFQYTVNGQYAASSPGDTFFDLGGPIAGTPASTLGGYFQIQTAPVGAGVNSGQVVFSNISISAVPEPASIGLLALGIPALLARRRRVMA